MLDLSEQLMHNTNDTNTKLLQTLCIGSVVGMWMCWTYLNANTTKRTFRNWGPAWDVSVLDLLGKLT